MSRVDLSGKTFGRLYVIGPGFGAKRNAFWRVKCECGQRRVLRTNRLTNGGQKSCGCLRGERLGEWQTKCRVKIVDGKRKCSKCKRMRPVGMFVSSKKTYSGLLCRCKECSTIAMWTTKHRISFDEGRRLLKLRNRGCSICGRKHSNRISEIHLDHNHRSGQVRGFLCGNCNRALGLLRESSQIIRAMLAYIVKWDKV